MSSKKAPLGAKRGNRCWAPTASFRLCGRKGNWAFLCNEHRSRRYILQTFFSTLTVLASIIALLSWRGCDDTTALRNGGVDVDVTLYGESQTSRAESENSFPQTTLKYSYERSNADLKIRYTLPYITLLSEGGPIRSFMAIANESRFTWQFPKLAIKVVNNTNRTILLSEAVIEVLDRQPNNEPILFVDSRYEYEIGGITYYNQMGGFHAINEGWGSVVNARVEYQAKTRGETKCAFSEGRGSLFLGTFADRADIQIVPQKVQEECVKRQNSFNYVDVTGVIRYQTENHQDRAVQFTTNVILGIARFPLGFTKVSAQYNVMLEVQKGKYIVSLPTSQEIKPGETDHFVIQIASDKSAHFDLRITFKETSGTTLLGKNLFIDIFRPRSDAREAIH